MLCPHLCVSFETREQEKKKNGNINHGLSDYLLQALKETNTIFDAPFTGNSKLEETSVSWACDWTEENRKIFVKAM